MNVRVQFSGTRAICGMQGTKINSVLSLKKDHSYTFHRMYDSSSQCSISKELSFESGLLNKNR